MERGQPQGRCGGLRGSCVGILPRWLQNGLLTSAGKGAREDVRARALSPATARPGSTQDVWCGVIARYLRGPAEGAGLRLPAAAAGAAALTRPAAPRLPPTPACFWRSLKQGLGRSRQPAEERVSLLGPGRDGLVKALWAASPRAVLERCPSAVSPLPSPLKPCVSGPTLVGPTPGPHLHWPHPCCMCRQRRRGRSFSRSSRIPSIFGSTSH